MTNVTSSQTFLKWIIFGISDLTSVYFIINFIALVSIYPTEWLYCVCLFSIILFHHYKPAVHCISFTVISTRYILSFGVVDLASGICHKLNYYNCEWDRSYLYLGTKPKILQVLRFRSDGICEYKSLFRNSISFPQ